jgi:hypothetical protein
MQEGHAGTIVTELTLRFGYIFILFVEGIFLQNINCIACAILVIVYVLV